MKRRALVLAMATMAALAIPSAAQATTFHGSCAFTDATYSFSGSGYAFGAALRSGGCSGSLNGNDAGYLVTWTSTGSGSFTCLGGTFTGGGGRLDFYSIDPLTQATSPVDTLDLADGGGAVLGAQVVRSVNGTRSGNAVETGTLSGLQACGSGRYVSTLRVVNGTLTD